MPIGNDLAVDLSAHVERAIHAAGTSRAVLHEEVVRFLVASQSSEEKDPDHTQTDYIERIDFEGLSSRQVFELLSEGQRRYLQTLSRRDASWYLYYHGADFMWDTVTFITEADTVEQRWTRRAEPQPVRAIAQEHLPAFLRVVENLPFASRGRMLILGVAPFQRAYRHFDESRELSEFMLMSFAPRRMPKSLTIETADGRKATVPVNALWFDERDWHEVAASPYFNYSIRIDGRFSETLRAELGRGGS